MCAWRIILNIIEFTTTKHKAWHLTTSTQCNISNLLNSKNIEIIQSVAGMSFFLSKVIQMKRDFFLHFFLSSFKYSVFHIQKKKTKANKPMVTYYNINVLQHTFNVIRFIEISIDTQIIIQHLRLKVLPKKLNQRIY